MNRSFYSARNIPPAKIIFNVGANRSGKTLIGNLLGSCRHVEHIDEPWSLMQWVILNGYGLLSEPLAADVFLTNLYETINDRILMRNANFRECDLSAIMRQKSQQEINERLALKSRDDVRNYLQKNPTTFVITLTNTGPFSAFLTKIPGDVKVMYVVRNGFEVAQEVVSKKWLSDAELKIPHHSNLLSEYREGSQSYYLPAWVKKGDEAAFVQSSEIRRAIYYWRKQLEGGPNQAGDKSSVMNFNGFMENPQNAFTRLAQSFGFAPTTLTQKLLEQIRPLTSEAPEAGIEPKETEKVKELHRIWGISEKERCHG